MSKENITIVEIAKLAGTSHATVSRVLSNPNYPVSEELRNRVMDIVRKYNYTPNINGRLLKQTMTSDVGIIVPNYDNPYYYVIVSDLEKQLSKDDISLIVMSTQNDPKIERRIIERILSRRPRAIVLLEGVNSPESIQLIHQKGVKLIALNQSQYIEGSYCIDTDCEYSSSIAVDFLYRLGHRRIGCISSPISTSSLSCVRYINGVKAAMQKHGLELAIECSETNEVLPGNLYSYEIGREMTSRLICNHPDLTAIIASNDITAMGAISILQEMGISVPDDISVIGRDDITMARMFSPSLTTVREPFGDVISSITHVLSLEEVAPTDEHMIVIRSQIIPRKSTKRIN